MSSDRTEVRAELAAAEQLPYGRPRTALVESLVERADALGEPTLARDTRLELISSYTFGGEPLKRFAPFAWVLSRYDADPTSFDQRARHHLLWQFKWLTVGSVNHPGVPLDRIEQGLADMRDRYQGAGEGLAPYLGCRYKVDAHVLGEPAAAESFQAWVRAPRTLLSDCQACEPSSRSDHLAGVGRYQDAVREAMPVLLNGGCLEQPQGAIAGVLEALLRTGDAERAAAEHLRGVRLMRGESGQTWRWALHILVLARSGRVLRGLDLLEDHLAEVDDPQTPYHGMGLAAAGARLLRGLEDAGYGDLPVTVPAPWSSPGEQAGARSSAVPGRDVGAAVQWPVADVAERLTRTARGLAAQFDARNGTDAIGRLTESWLDADALPDLPLDSVITRRATRNPTPVAGRAVAGSIVRPAAVPSPLAVPSSLGTAAAPRPGPGSTAAELVERFEESRLRQDAGLRREVLRTWRRLKSGAADAGTADAGTADAGTADAGTADAGTADAAIGPLDAARLDAALAFDDVVDDGADPQVLRQAVDRLHDLGDPWLAGAYALGALRHEVETGATGGADGEQLLARLDALLEQARIGCSAGQRGNLAVGALAVLFAAAGRGLLDPVTAHERIGAAIQEGLALLESVPAQELSVVERGGLAVLTVQQAATLDPEPRLERLRAAWDLLEPGQRAQERAVVGLEFAPALAEADQLTAALDVLAEVAGDGVICDIPALSARALAMSARIRRALGHLDEAVADFVRAGQWLQADQLRQGDTGPEELAATRRDLAFALQECGRVLEAAEVAETAVPELEEELERLGIRPSAELPAAAGTDPAELLARPVLGLDARSGTDPSTSGTVGDPRAEAAARLAGTLRYAAAEACSALDENARAAEHARMSARWHRACGWRPAEAEALALAGRTEPDRAEGLLLLLGAATLQDADGRWDAAARSRRIAAGAALEAHGLSVARQVIAAATTALDAHTPEDGDVDRHRWERYALAEETARVLARGGAVEEALSLLAGLEKGYRDLGDLGSVWDVQLLRAECLEHLDRTEEGLADLEAAAAEALQSGAAQRARQLGGSLAAMLDDLGRADDAEAAWRRFSGETG